MNRFGRAWLLIFTPLSMTSLMPAHAGDAEREAQLEHFKKIAPVFLHPRCRDCHAAGDAPLQTDAGIRQAMNVKRDKEGVGMPAANCVICHTATPIRQESGLPPAVMDWRMPLAKRKMRFEDLSSAELRQHLQKPEITGRKTVGKSMIHVLRDVLVSWVFEPGPGHTAQPIGKKVLFKRIGRWVRGGAPCDDDPVK